MAAAYEETSKNPFVDELDELEFDTAVRKLEAKQRSILNSTNRSLNLIEESHDIAIKTAEELQCQEEQLHRIDRNLDDMRGDLTSANRHIKSVKSVWGAIGNYFSKPPPEDKKKVTSKHSLKESSIPERPARIETDLKLNYGEQDYLSDYGRGRETANFERQYNSQLGEMSRGLGVLKNDAMILGNTIDRHNEMIDRIQGKSDLVSSEVKEADWKVRRILGRK